MTPEKVIEVQKYGREPISLYTPLGEDGDGELGDLIEDSEAIQPGDAVGFTTGLAPADPSRSYSPMILSQPVSDQVVAVEWAAAK